ncbi:hypothetical protein DFP72DRAFT_320215 [Ephemerocybe angulata]|uniref:RING-type domain-containing protein n=1 Tax=Ephemerocybe angulata TaxID=980116 RepID=A0A8H6MH54_9AGAR|nr:hypothetical protein DFP72DRAFT_320215 [Tulosesus angulatus]
MPATKFLCPICMKSYERHQLLVLWNCGHAFCKTCLELRQASTCALCNTPYYPPRRTYVEDTPEGRARCVAADVSNFLIEPSSENSRNLRQSLSDVEHNSGEGMSDDTKEALHESTRRLEAGIKILREEMEEYRGGGGGGGVQSRESRTAERQSQIDERLSQIDESLSHVLPMLL